MTTADQEGWGGALEGAREPVEDPFASPDPSRANRVRALICTEPLHDLQTNRGRRGPLFTSLDCYDIALAVIDFVVDHMGFDSGLSREQSSSSLPARSAPRLRTSMPMRSEKRPS